MRKAVSNYVLILLVIFSPFGACFLFPSGRTSAPPQRRTHSFDVAGYRTHDSFKRIISKPERSRVIELKEFNPSLSVSDFSSVSRTIAAEVHNNPWYVMTVLMFSSSCGLWTDKNKLGETIGGPVVTMMMTMFLCNAKIIPSSSTTYDFINKALVPMSIPLLLLNSDLKKIFKHSGKLAVCFIIGSIGTAIGTIIATILVPLNCGQNGWKIAAALAASYIGGTVNYIAVAETFRISSDVVLAGLAADNVVMAMYLTFLFKKARPNGTSVNLRTRKTLERNDPVTESEASFGKISIAYSLTIGCAIAFVGNVLTKSVLRGGISEIAATTLVSVLLATAFPKILSPLSSSGSKVGLIFMQLFFAATGASGSITSAMRTAPMLLVFSFVQLAVHFLFVVAAGRALKLPFNQLLLASNANVGGPTTAAAFAVAKKWDELILPAILTGTLGYAYGTFAGIALGNAVLSKLPSLWSL